MPTSRKPTTQLPPDAAAHVARLPPWLQDAAAGAFGAVDDAGARQAAREHSDTEAAKNRQRLAELAACALRGDYGKDAQGSVTRVLNGVTPLRAEPAVLVMCEGIVREAKKQRAAKRHVPHFGKGAK